MISLTGKNVSLIGMVHTRALPGTPRSCYRIEEIIKIAVEEAKVLRDSGFDAILVENMHDIPYLKRKVGPEIVASMTAILCEVKKAVDCPVGIQILAGANHEALSAALASGAEFIRVEGFAFAHVADEGIMESDAGELLRFRKLIGAEKIKIFADIKKKHSSHAITADVNLSDTAHAAEFFGADALVITGSATGRETSQKDLEEAAKGANLPLIVGSGTTPDNLISLWKYCQGFIIGSYIKKNGKWDQELDPGRIMEIIKAAKSVNNEQ
jgi:uncharacterized protein